MSEPLTKSRDSLRSLANFLTETGLRAQVMGQTAPAFSISSLVNMAATIMEAVVAIEAATGSTAAPTQPAPPSQPTPAVSDAAKAQAAVQEAVAAIRAEAERVRLDAMENLRKQMSEMQAQLKPGG